MYYKKFTPQAYTRLHFFITYCVLTRSYTEKNTQNKKVTELTSAAGTDPATGSCKGLSNANSSFNCVVQSIRFPSSYTSNLVFTFSSRSIQKNHKKMHRMKVGLEISFHRSYDHTVKTLRQVRTQHFMEMTNSLKYSTCNVKQISSSCSLQKQRRFCLSEARTCCLHVVISDMKK